MHYLVLDLEWNISTKRAGEQASDQEIKEEIIEIGAVCLDSAFEPADRFSVDVKPRYHKKMHSYIGRLIQRENDSLKEGLPFPEAIQKFRAWLQGHGIEDYIFCTWSTSDSGPWLENMRHYGLLEKKPPLFLNVQHLFAVAEEQHGNQRSVAYAVEFFGLPLTEPFYRAVNDAYYTALIFKKTIELLQEKGKLPLDRRRLDRKLRSWAYDPSLNYKSRLELTNLNEPSEQDDYLKTVVWTCPACGRELQELEPWKRRKRPFKRHSFAICPEHGRVQIKVVLYRDMQAVRAGAKAGWKLRADLAIKRPM